MKVVTEHESTLVYACGRSSDLPHCLEHLLSWNANHVISASQHNLLRDVTGLDTSQCHVFLPCLADMASCDNLRAVPPPQTEDEELPFIEKLPASKPLIKVFFI